MLTIPAGEKCTGEKKCFVNKTDTSLYFLTVEKVAVSLPTKCLSNPMSGSVLIGDYRLGPAHFPGQSSSYGSNLCKRVISINGKYINTYINQTYNNYNMKIIIE